jgi:hypothetical protein
VTSRRVKFRSQCVVVLSLTSLLFGVGTAAADNIALSESNGSGTRECHGGAVAVAGSGNHYRIAGDCAALQIIGTDNHVTIQLKPGGSISFVGSDNDVAYSLAADGPEPTVSSVGGDNRVHREGAAAAGATSSATPSNQGSIVTSDNGIDIVGPGGHVRIGPGGIDAQGSGGAHAEIQHQAPARPDAGALIITGAASAQTYDCAGRMVLVRSSASSIRLTGACGGLQVEGSGNTISIDLGRNAPIVITGSGNTVRWRTPDSTEPVIQSPGSGNTVLRFSAFAIDEEA